jgi:enoyl-CoA hydratase/carnithine racemase
MTEWEHIEVSRQGRITTVTLNRPAVMNALHYPAHCELAAAFDDFAQDPDQWVAIVTGAGDRAFCAGVDLKYQADGDGLKAPSSGFAGLTSRFDLYKPVIAAVNGVAMGGGFETALACDIIIAAEHAVFALPEPRVGLVALGGGVLRLPRAIGMMRAMEIAMRTRRVSASEGQILGFISQVVPLDALMDTARSLAEDLCLSSPKAMQATKQAMLRGYDQPLEQAMAEQWGYSAMTTLFASNDVIEGPKAFTEKRPPRWSP